MRRIPRGWMLAGRIALQLLGVLFVVWAVATLTFFSMRLIPGDPAEAIVGGPGARASEETLAQARADYGLDQPLALQYLHSLGRLLSGDLGTSYSLKEGVNDVIAEQLGGTLLLALCALALAWALALGLALCSTREGRFSWAVGSGLEIVSAALPTFWLASILITVFSTELGILPPISVPGPVGLILPAVTLAIPLAGFLGQVMRESMLNALESPFVLTARARGESEIGVRRTHAVRHAALPAVSLSGWAFGSLISGAVVVETVFARPGLGRTLLRAVTDRDVPLVSGVVIVVALVYMVVLVVTDILDRLVDPRLRRA